jgi:hypothetical protein
MGTDLPETKSPFEGDAAYQITGKVLNILAEGPFTSDLLSGIALLDASNPVLKLRQEGPWGLVIVFKNSAMASAETVQDLTNYETALYRHSEFKPMTALVLHPMTEGVETMRPLYLHCFRSSGLICNVFENYPDARSWVEEQIRNNR